MKLEEEREGQSNETNSFTVQARIVKEKKGNEVTRESIQSVGA